MSARLTLADGAHLDGVELTDTEILVSSPGDVVRFYQCRLTRCDLSRLGSGVVMAGCILVDCAMPSYRYLTL